MLAVFKFLSSKSLKNLANNDLCTHSLLIIKKKIFARLMSKYCISLSSKFVI